LFEEKTDNFQKESLNPNRINFQHPKIDQAALTTFKFKENPINTNEKTTDSYEEEKLSEKSEEARSASEAYSPDITETKITNKYEGWLKIKSESFINSRIFPREQVKYDKDFFRINNLNLEQTDKFYFTLSEKFLQYKPEERSLNLLQVIRVDAIQNLKYYPILYDNLGSGSLHCADFQEKYDEMYTNFYKICSEDLAVFNKFFCSLAQTQSLKFTQCMETSKIQTELQVEILKAQVIIPLPSKYCNENFNYKSHGEDWECLCKEGLNQSPIDLPKPNKAILSPVSPIFEFDEIPYEEELMSRAGLPKQELPTQIKLENEVLKISKKTFGKILTLNSEVLTANDIIFHTPSEHTIAEKRFDMEMQIIYKNNSGRSAVLVFLFEKKAGYFNKFLDDIDFYNLPNKNYKTKNVINKLFIPKIFYNNINSEKDFDKNEMASVKPFSFYTYEGSITQPPCNEEAKYYIASEPLPVAGITLQLAQEALKRPEGPTIRNIEEPSFLDDRVNNLQENKSAEGNYRAIQKLNGRKVHFYDHKIFSNNLKNFILKAAEKEGHFEKIKITKKEVIYVDGDKPSDIPGAFLIGDDQLLS